MRHSLPQRMKNSRRIVRRAVMALAVVVLPVWYVAAWLAVSRATHDGFISGPMAARLAPVFAPIRHYAGRYSGPGSRELYDAWWAVNPVSTPGVWVEFTPDQQ